jgi:hypothetical protein
MPGAESARVDTCSSKHTVASGLPSTASPAETRSAYRMPFEASRSVCALLCCFIVQLCPCCVYIPMNRTMGVEQHQFLHLFCALVKGSGVESLHIPARPALEASINRRELWGISFFQCIGQVRDCTLLAFMRQKQATIPARFMCSCQRASV